MTDKKYKILGFYIACPVASRLRSGLLFGVTLIFAFSILNFAVAHAQGSITVPGGGNTDLENAVEDLNELGRGSPVQNAPQFLALLATIVKWMYTIFFIVAIALILFAAFNYLFAQGDATKISTAHKQLIWAAVAIAVALISVGTVQIINSFIRNATGGTTGPSTRSLAPIPGGIDSQAGP